MKTVDAIKYYKTQADIATVLKITQPAISLWGEIVPLRRAIKLSQLSNGKIPLNGSDYFDPEGSQ